MIQSWPAIVSSVNNMSPAQSVKRPLCVVNSIVPLSVMTSCRAGSGCHPSFGSVSVSWNDTEAIGNLPLSVSPRWPGSRSMMPSSKCEWPSRPLHNLMHRIIVVHSSMLGRLIVLRSRPDFAAKDVVADGGVDQHQREDEEALSPEHEGKTGMGCRRFMDGDDEGNHVGPERYRQGSKRRDEDHDNHGEGPSVAATTNADSQPNCRHHRDRREDEQIRTLEPSTHELKVFGECVDEHDDQEDKHTNREIGYLAISGLADCSITFLDQPTGTKQRIAEAQPQTAKRGKGTEPAEVAAGILAVFDRKAFDEGTNGHSLDERRRERSAGEAPIPNPSPTFRLVAKLKSDPAKDQTRQHDKQRQIECRK